jgi:magnesium transporter
MVHVGKERTGTVAITQIDYDPQNFRETAPESADEVTAPEKRDGAGGLWINVDGVHRVDIIETIGKKFDIHPLTLEDIVNTHQRAKVEDYGNYLYIVCRMLFHDKTGGEVHSEQVSLVLGEGFLISFQEEEGDVFNGVRERLRKGRGRIRQSGCDYLAYCLMDAIVDHYFVVLGAFGDKIEALEEDLMDSPTEEISRAIHRMKRETIHLGKQVRPLREVLVILSKGGFDQVKESTGVFLRDVHDHTVQAMDTIESYRDILSGMMDSYHSLMGNRMNEVMKLLTIIATIFIPITFLAGVYGMNFKYMPELDWKWGYFACLGVMAGVVVAMLIYFKKKDWL